MIIISKICKSPPKGVVPRNQTIAGQFSPLFVSNTSNSVVPTAPSLKLHPRPSQEDHHYACEPTTIVSNLRYVTRESFLLLLYFALVNYVVTSGAVKIPVVMWFSWKTAAVFFYKLKIQCGTDLVLCSKCGRF